MKTKCGLCFNACLTDIMSLGNTPLANEFLDEQNLNQDTFPLNLKQCVNCKNVQLDYAVDPDRLYKNYLYVSGTSSVNVQHFKDYADNVLHRFFQKISKDRSYNDLLIDIGSNDGTFLKQFDNKIRTIGVDPATKIAVSAIDSGIKTINNFFNEIVARTEVLELLETTQTAPYKAKVITANHVFAHTKDLHIIMGGVKFLLSDDGTFIFENSYLLDMVNKGIFDVIYHEHFYHHHLTPLVNFFKQFDMRIYDVERFPNQHGGSFRAYVCHVNDITNNSSKFDEMPIVKELLYEESLMNVNLADKFKTNTIGLTQKLRNELTDKNITIGIYGYPAKATSLVRFCGLITYDKNLKIHSHDSRIKFVVDDAVLKQGKYIPGGEFIVQSPDVIKTYKPDYILILAWNFADSIIKNHPEVAEYGGKWIVPIPELKVI